MGKARATALRAGRLFEPWQWAVLAGMLLVGLVGGFAVYERLYRPHVERFAPYTLYGFESVPEAACAGEPIKVSVDREIGGPNPSYQADFDTYWTRERPDGQMDVFGSSSGRIELERHPRKLVESPILRTAPDAPGEWFLETRLIVSGSIRHVEREQELTARARDPITVLPPGDPRCAGRASADATAWVAYDVR